MSVTVRMSAPVVTRFRLGDSVSTLFGATQMHVVRLRFDEDYPVVWCSWMDGDQLRTGPFMAAGLRRAKR